MNFSYPFLYSEANPFQKLCKCLIYSHVCVWWGANTLSPNSCIKARRVAFLPSSLSHFQKYSCRTRICSVCGILFYIITNYELQNLSIKKLSIMNN